MSLPYDRYQFAEISRRWSVLSWLYKYSGLTELGLSSVSLSYKDREQSNFHIREKSASTTRPMIAFERGVSRPGGSGATNTVASRILDYRLILVGEQMSGLYLFSSEDTLDILAEHLFEKMNGVTIPYYDMRAVFDPNVSASEGTADPEFDFVLNWMGDSRSGEVSEQDRNKLIIRFQAEV